MLIILFRAANLVNPSKVIKNPLTGKIPVFFQLFTLQNVKLI